MEKLATCNSARQKNQGLRCTPKKTDIHTREYITNTTTECTYKWQQNTKLRYTNKYHQLGSSPYILFYDVAKVLLCDYAVTAAPGSVTGRYGHIPGTIMYRWCFIGRSGVMLGLPRCAIMRLQHAVYCNAEMHRKIVRIHDAQERSFGFFMERTDSALIRAILTLSRLFSLPRGYASMYQTSQFSALIRAILLFLWLST